MAKSRPPGVDPGTVVLNCGAVDLIHMNGRIFDPLLGRFLSADPNIDGVSDSQGYNRYSYVHNNPLNATDPSGYLSLKEIGVMVAAVVVGVLTAGAAIYAYGAIMAGSTGAWVGGFAAALSSVGSAAGWGVGWAAAAGAGFGFGSAFTASLLNGASVGDAFKAGVIGGVAGGIAGAATSWAGANIKDPFAQNLAKNAIEGARTEATGGEFRHGFYSGMASSAAAPVTSRLDGGAGFVASVAVGGTASELGGGKFANGAVGSAFQYLMGGNRADPGRGGSRLGNGLRRFPALGLAAGPAGDLISGLGNVLTLDIAGALADFGYAIYYPINRVVDDIGSTTAGLFGNVYGIARGVQEMGKALLHGGSGMGKAFQEFRESFVWRYGTLSGPGWGLTHRVFGATPSKPFFANSIEGAAFWHDAAYGPQVNSQMRAADLQFVRDLWSGQQPGPIGQVYRVIATPMFYLKGKYGEQTP